MKRNVLVIAGLAVLSTSAFASKARMEALGQSTGGSHYIQDSRSVFLNPAHVNTMKNYIVTEWGASSVTTDDAATPRAEGGFFRENGSFSYGLYLGNDSARIAAGTGFLKQSNALDLFMAGDMGMKWGARLHYANGKDEGAAASTDDKKHSALGLGLGVSHGDLEAYANIDLSDKSTGNGTVASYESKLKPSFTLGASYAWMGYSFFAEYQADKREETTATTTTSKNSYISVGAGRSHELNPGARLFTDVTLHMDKTNSGTGDVKTNKLPITLGVEADATSWLTLRGSVSQNVILGETKSVSGQTTTIANSTTVNAGATLNFGKLKVDGMIGNTGNTRGTGAVGTAAANKQGTLTTDNLLTRVGVTYNF